MNVTMNDLLEKNHVAALARADDQRGRENQAVERAAWMRTAHDAFLILRDRMNAVVGEFNGLSDSGRIEVKDWGDGTWQFFMPNTANILTLAGNIELCPKQIKGRLCRISAKLVDDRGRGMHFLFLEDETSADGKWAALRVTNNVGSQPRSTVEPFISTLNEIATGLRGKHAILPQFSSGLDDAVREMLGYALAS